MRVTLIEKNYNKIIDAEYCEEDNYRTVYHETNGNCQIREKDFTNLSDGSNIPYKYAFEYYYIIINGKREHLPFMQSAFIQEYNNLKNGKSREIKN